MFAPFFLQATRVADNNSLQCRTSRLDRLSLRVAAAASTGLPLATLDSILAKKDFA
jgi:hypothetical protein